MIYSFNFSYVHLHFSVVFDFLQTVSMSFAYAYIEASESRISSWLISDEADAGIGDSDFHVPY